MTWFEKKREQLLKNMDYENLKEEKKEEPQDKIRDKIFEEKAK